MTDSKPILNIKSLKEQVYEHLREQMRTGGLRPGAAIDMEETSKRLGVSKTPLRDALLQLEMEGFVTILPRRKIVVNVLTLQNIRDYLRGHRGPGERRPARGLRPSRRGGDCGRWMA